MRNKFINLTILLLFLVLNTQAQDLTFQRMSTIPVPFIESCGFGNVVTGVDFDNDGKTEIYAVNNMADQEASELVPRLYKFEFNGVTWDSVWSATMRNIPLQNSWGALSYGDWDQDGRMEIIWGPSNYFEGYGFVNPNPPRIIVFEARGDGSDKMGVDNFGFDIPNATWTIVDEDNFELRPFKWELSDIDSDGDIELVFASRSEGHRYGVISVSDIPNFGGGSEVWTLETSGLDGSITNSPIYDLAVIDNRFYLFHDLGTVTGVEYSGGIWSVSGTAEELVPGGSWKSLSVVDLNNDGRKEIVVGVWQNIGNLNTKILLVEEDDNNFLKMTQIADFDELLGSASRFNGGDFGDIDNDGNIDFVFGTRGAVPNGAIAALYYKGGDITDPNNYTKSVIDSLLSETETQRFDIVRIFNADEDPELEVLYTDGNQKGRIPIVILDPTVQVGVGDDFVSNSFFLEQNYPNPFNPSTTIRFGLEKASMVTLRVFDILGRELYTLLDGEFREAGTYNLSLDGTKLSSGTYIYTLQAGEQRFSRKMSLIK